ncbi:MAG: 6-pyruvoyl trahydropterin synthase family protein [Blastocatellia bacterium]
MYKVSVKGNFVAKHFLIGGDWGRESQMHSHDYQVEVQLEGATLDRHGYLVDIVDIKAHLGSLLDYFRNGTLNEMREFEGLNPSLEHFARIFCQTLSSRIEAPHLSALTVKLWEDESAWAAYRQER